MSSSVFQKDAIGQPGTRENDSLLPRVNENEILSCLVIMLKKRKSGLRPIQNFFFIISRLSTTLNLIQVFKGKFSIQRSSVVELRQVTQELSHEFLGTFFQIYLYPVSLNGFHAAEHD